MKKSARSSASSCAVFSTCSGLLQCLPNITESDLSDDSDINREISSIYVLGNTILTYFRHCSKEVKILFFKTYFRFFMLRTIGANIKRQNANILVSYNRIFRLLFLY